MIYPSNIFVRDAADSPTEPVTLADQKAWMSVDFTDHDTLITGMIKGARIAAENETNLALVAKLVTLDAELTRCEIMTLPFTHSPTALTIARVNDDGTTDDLTADSDYNARGNMIYGLLKGLYAVTYTAEPLANTAISEAIKMEVTDRYHNRGENQRTTVRSLDEKTDGLSRGFKDKLRPYKQIWL